MKKSGGPVREFPLAEKALREFKEIRDGELPDFGDTEKTFGHLTDRQLTWAKQLFTLMGQSWLTRVMGSVGVRMVNWRLPGSEWVVRNTIFPQFVGGSSLVSALPTIERLAARGVSCILDYGAEAKDERSEMDRAMKEILRAVEFSAATDTAIGAVIKVSSLFPYRALEEFSHRKLALSGELPADFQVGLKRLDAVCSAARQRNCELYIDAEESWIQDTIDQLAELMMERYNGKSHIVFTTCQLYRHDRLAYLRAAHERARAGGYLFAAKVVRGAYMDKERARAARLGYASPIQPDLAATHRDYNAAVAYCLDHYEEIACCVATHNEESTRRVVTRLRDEGIPRDHPNVRFSQLLGMSDNLTFNLAEGGYNVSKYMVYGPVRDVLPYLVRRAQENTSVTGEAGRELTLIKQEIARRRRS